MFAYLASFDASQLLGTIAVAGSGHSTATVTLNTITSTAVSGGGVVKVFNHHPTGLGSTVGADKAATHTLATKYSASSWGAVVQAALRAQASSVGWGTDANSIFVGYSTVLQRYTITYAPANLTVTFTGPAAALFGFTGNLSGSVTYTAPNPPYTAIIPSLSACSMTSTTEGIDYEPEDITTQAVSAQGVIFGLSRGVTPLCRDWTQQFEAKSKVMRAVAGSFSHQQLFETCRGDKPFVITDNYTGFNEVFFLRGDSSNWGRDIYEMVALAYDSFYHVKYRTYYVGTIA